VGWLAVLAGAGWLACLLACWVGCSAVHDDFDFPSSSFFSTFVFVRSFAGFD